MVPASIPSSRPTAVAASTLGRWPRPGSAIVSIISPAGVRTAAAVPATPRSSTSTARTSAPADTPKVTVRPANVAARAITSGSSALATSSVLA